jgi:hypothetical protein
VSTGWPMVPGVPACGHVARNGAWHPGSERTCTRTPCKTDDPKPTR